MNLPLNEHSIQLRNAPQSSTTNFIYMVIYIYEPLTLLKVLQGENKMQCEQAIREEYQSLMINQTWDLAKLPTRKKPMGYTWVFQIKCKGDGSMHCSKARLVVRELMKHMHFL